MQPAGQRVAGQRRLRRAERRDERRLCRARDRAAERDGLRRARRRGGVGSGGCAETRPDRPRRATPPPADERRRRRLRVRLAPRRHRDDRDRRGRPSRQRRAAAQRVASESRRGSEWCAVSSRAVSGSDCVRRSAAEDADDDGRRAELRSDCATAPATCARRARATIPRRGVRNTS